MSIGGDPGDRVVVMGPNGSGKSTLLRLVSTELPSRPGSLTLFGEACGPPTRDLRKKIGIEGALFSAVAALLLLHWAGTFRSPVPGTWQATLEAWNPFRPLHESLLAAATGGGPDLDPALLVPPIGVTVAVLLLITTAGRYAIGLGGR